ncbi:cyclodeaminase/cyclohydrolase family protein [Arthrobacter monumenti]
MMIGEQRISEYLDHTASDSPAPGGGATAALQLAQAAALTCMSARFTTGAKFDQYAPLVQRVLAETKPLITESLKVADADAAAFAKVADSYGMPHISESEKHQRTRAIQESLVAATEPPKQLIGLARTISRLGEMLLGCANPNILSDIAAAAAAARAAATIAQATLEINLVSIKDDPARRSIEDHIRDAGEVIDFCDDLTERIRAEITS